MDQDNSGQLDISDIKLSYNAKKHPEVLMGNKSEDDVLYEFLDTFEQHYSILHPDGKSRDRVVTLPEWLEYYNNISCSIDNDEYFATMMQNAYNLSGEPAVARAWGGQF